MLLSPRHPPLSMLMTAQLLWLRHKLPSRLWIALLLLEVPVLVSSIPKSRVAQNSLSMPPHWTVISLASWRPWASPIPIRLALLTSMSLATLFPTVSYLSHWIRLEMNPKLCSLLGLCPCPPITGSPMGSLPRALLPPLISSKSSRPHLSPPPLGQLWLTSRLGSTAHLPM
jgi:hypothetical protein